ncbi:hypothetical protein GCM10027030_27430 [Luteococcus sediminum]
MAENTNRGLAVRHLALLGLAVYAVLDTIKFFVVGHLSADNYVGLIVMAVFTLITYGVHWANARKTKAASDDSHTDA